MIQTVKINDDKLQSLFGFSKCKKIRFQFLFFEDLGTNQIGSNDLEFTDDLIALEFASHFGGFFTLFDGGLDRLKSVPVQSHNGFDLSAIWRRFLKLLAKLEFQLHALQHSGGLEAEGLGIRVISDLEFWGRKGGSLPQSNIYVQFSEKLLVIFGGGASVFSQILVVFSHCYVLQKMIKYFVE